MSDEPTTDPAGWLDRHGDILYRYALWRVRSPDMAADVVQETFLEALRARDSYQGRSSERTWLVGILRHKIIDQLRKSRRDRVRDEQRAADAGAGGPAPEAGFDRHGHWRAGPGAWKGDPSRVLESREFWEVLGDCLARMPARLADAFILRELDGLDADHVREVLGITPENLWARLSRARGLLRGCLEVHWFRPPGKIRSASSPLMEIEIGSSRT